MCATNKRWMLSVALSQSHRINPNNLGHFVFGSLNYGARGRNLVRLRILKSSMTCQPVRIRYDEHHPPARVYLLCGNSELQCFMT